MKTRVMAEDLVAKLIEAYPELRSVPPGPLADGFEIFADRVIAEAWSRASATIEQAAIGLKYDDGA